ncbi:MAG: NAD-dependent epimerase/dehydratase family protein, partial [Thermoproteota archaeon]|nr:NAD-dependent epimerase/dehydratase family protein [Thermoproteota archaeon]
MSKVLITGGAGFIGSSLADRLVQLKHEVIVFDNLSSGSEYKSSNLLDRPNFRLIKADVLDKSSLSKSIHGCVIVFHFAGNTESRLDSGDTNKDFEQNLLATYNLLEVMRNSTSCKKIIFASSSAVYGEPDKIPTSEKYSPLVPISLYGASKLGCEALISGYCHMFQMSGIVLRLSNVVGPRATHGVVYDFIIKLTKNPTYLDILGDGQQNKSYLYIDDCIDALTLMATMNKSTFQIFNMGSKDRRNVLDIANIVVKELALHNVRLRFTDRPDGRGWNGDTREMLLDS